ncbi:MAG: nucleoside triphosphate pyrophosphohydrolase [Bdellovibrionota bacterium]
MSGEKKSIESFMKLIETVRKLRSPEGCPWDLAQTHQTLRQYLVEETYEVIDVLDRIDSSEKLSDDKLCSTFREELGDLLMQVLIHSQLASEQGRFDIFDVAEGLNDKLIRRHPHVFGTAKADSPESAYKNWEQQKAKEKATQHDSGLLAGLPTHIPALQRATRIIERATKAGFQWSDLEGPIAKVEEELGELKTELKKFQKESQKECKDADNAEARKKIENELGDLLFSLCNLAYLVKVNPEDALREMLKRFEIRFRHVEARLKEHGKTFEHSTLEEMDRYWNEAKKEGK